MKNILDLLRQLALRPRKVFEKTLKNRIQKSFKEQYQELQWWKIKVDPAQDFKKRLRYQLLDNFNIASEKKVKVRMVSRFEWLLFPAKAGMASLLVLALLISPITILQDNVSIGAAGTTLISEKSGEVMINGRPTDINQSLHENDMITVADESAMSIHFFEDSLARIAPESEVTIKELQTSMLRDDLGSVKVRLNEGMIWLRSLSAQDTFSTLTLELPQGDVIVRSGALGVLVSKYYSVVIVADQSALLSTDNANMMLVPGQMVKIGNNNDIDSNYQPTQNTLQEWHDQNIKADEVVLRYFIAEKIAAEQRELQQRFGEKTEFSEMETSFWNIAEKNLKSSLDYDELGTLVQNLKNEHTKQPTKVDALLASINKALAPVLPDEKLYELKTAMENLQSSFSKKAELYAANQRNKRLWEARRLITQGKTELAAAHIETAHEVEETTINEATKSDAEVSELLQAEAEQMANLEAAEAQGVSEEIIEEATEKVVSRAIMIAHKSKVNRTIRQEHAKLNKQILDSIDLYKDTNGQKNVLAARLKEVTNNSESLELMQRLQNNLPAEFTPQINKKIVEILESERQKQLRKK